MCSQGRVEQGIAKPDEEVVFLPTHTALNPGTEKVFTVEVHQRIDQMYPGDNVGLNIKGLDKNNIPWSGDDMMYKKAPPWVRPGSSTRRLRFLKSRDDVGLNIKGLDKNNMPRSGNDMVCKKVPPWARPGSSTRRLPDEEVVFLLTAHGLLPLRFIISEWIGRFGVTTSRVWTRTTCLVL